MLRARCHVMGLITAIAPAVLLSTFASAQSLTPINRANMETGLFNADVFSTLIEAANLDIDGNGVLEFDEMGCFGEMYDIGGYLTPASVAAFDANILVIDSIDGTIESTVPGIDLFIGYLASIVGDGQGQATLDLIAIIDEFSTAGGGPGTNWMTLAALGFDASQGDDIEGALLGTCIDIAGQVLMIFGPTALFLDDFPVTYTAVTVDTFDPFFTETHTFSSSNPNVLSITANGVATPVAPGTADVIAIGDISAVYGQYPVVVGGLNPALPAVSALMLGVLSGALAAAGVRRIRRVR